MGPLLRKLEKLIGTVANSSEGSPKTSSFLGILGVAGSVWAALGFNPDVVNNIGSILVRLGGLLEKF